MKSQNAYAVIVGIGKYKDPEIPVLKYAKADALEIYDTLTDPRYGNFPKENVKLLIDEEATLTKIRSAMGTFLARNAGEEDIVCIYFAGHGSPEIDPTGRADDRLEKFLVPYDARRDDLFGYGLSMDVIQGIFRRIASKRVVFFIDSCYSGAAGGRTFSRPDVSTRNITISDKFLDRLSGEGRVIITASKPDELSLETDKLGHGIFTYYLAEGLKGKADFNNDGFVTVDELYKYVSGNVTREARSMGGAQHPVRKGETIGEIPLTNYESKKVKQIKKFNSNAGELFEKGEYEKALAEWEKVLKIYPENKEAKKGIENAKRKVEEKEREAKKKKKEEKLFSLSQEKELPIDLYTEALKLIDSDRTSLNEEQKEILGWVEDLLREETDPKYLNPEHYKKLRGQTDSSPKPKDIPPKPAGTSPRPVDSSPKPKDIPTVCSKCGFSNKFKKKFCPLCGTKFQR